MSFQNTWTRTETVAGRSYSVNMQVVLFDIPTAIIALLERRLTRHTLPYAIHIYIYIYIYIYISPYSRAPCDDSSDSLTEAQTLQRRQTVGVVHGPVRLKTVEQLDQLRHADRTGSATGCSVPSTSQRRHPCTDTVTDHTFTRLDYYAIRRSIGASRSS